MSAVAEAALHCGWRVSGSDRRADSRSRSTRVNLPAVPLRRRGAQAGTTPERQSAEPNGLRPDVSAPDVLELLAECGAEIFPQDGSGVTDDCAALVVSTAIEEDNPDMLAARRQGVAVWHRAECLAHLVGNAKSVAVTGTSGKSTVTGMLGCIIEAAGLDPAVVNGAPVLNWMDNGNSGSVRRGAMRLWIYEADESDRSLMSFSPEWAAVTNISTDHFPREEAEALFNKFAAQVKSGMVWPDETEDAYSLEDGATWSPLLRWQGLACRLRVPGRHNAANAVTAARLARMMGVAGAAIVDGLEAFRGIARRLELVGEQHGVMVVDDYAHNPAKISASLQAMQALCGGRLRVIWRPHGYGPLRLMLQDLAQVFAATMRPDDRLLLLPVYDAGGTADRSINATALAEAITAQGGQAQVVADEAEAAGLVLEAAAGDLIMTMGARDPGLPELARAILGAMDAGEEDRRLQTADCRP